MFRALIRLGVVALLVAGCATTANYKKICQSWIGYPEDKLYMSWGLPQEVRELDNGVKIISYRRSRNMQVGGYSYTTPQTTYNSGNVSAYGRGGYAHGSYSGTSTTYVQRQTPVYNVNKYCDTVFAINKTGHIVKWSFSGNDCRAHIK